MPTVAVAELADPCCPAGDEIAVAVGRVPLRVARHGAGLLRLRQRIVRQCEVIHSDIDIARIREALDRPTKDCQSVRGTRAIRLLHPALSRELLRQMGVVVDGNTTGRQIDDTIERARKAPKHFL